MERTKVVEMLEFFSIDSFDNAYVFQITRNAKKLYENRKIRR